MYVIDMGRHVYVIGVGMSKFAKPKAPSGGYVAHGIQAIQEALADARMQYRQIDAVVASYCYGEPTAGQRVVYEAGLTGIPVFNVNNNCSSASSALFLARSLIRSGDFNNVLAVGFEEMEGGLSERYPEKESPVRRHLDHLDTLSGKVNYDNGMTEMTNGVIRMFSEAAKEYMQLYPDTKVDDFVKIAQKNREMGRINPKACFFGAPELYTKAVAKEVPIFDEQAAWKTYGLEDFGSLIGGIDVVSLNFWLHVFLVSLLPDMWCKCEGQAQAKLCEK